MAVNKRRDLQGQSTQNTNVTKANIKCVCTKQKGQNKCICPAQTAGYLITSYSTRKNK